MVTLNHPAQGDTNWYSPVDQIWAKIESTIKCILSWGSSIINGTGALARWAFPSATNDVAINSMNSIIQTPFAGVLKNLYFQLAGAPGASAGWIATVWVNNASTGITVTISGASATSGTDTTHTVSVSAGDNVEVRVTNQGNPNGQLGIASLEIDPT